MMPSSSTPLRRVRRLGLAGLVPPLRYEHDAAEGAGG